MARNEELIVVGVITGAHGVRGDVRVKSFTAEPEALFNYAPFFDKAGEILLTPKAVRSAKDSFIVSPEIPRQKEGWDRLKGTTLHVPRHILPHPNEDEFYISDLIGLEVFTGGDEPTGQVKAVLDHGAGDLIEVAPIASGKSVLVPFTREDVPVVDLNQGRIIIATYDLWADTTGAPKPRSED